jgi:prepilin-type N-terminal cleavage/methylation domain-containing protein
MRRTAAFSLLEVMCAIVIVGVGLVGLTQGITTAVRTGKDSEIQTTAALIAAGQMEMLRADGFITAGETEGSVGQGTAAYHWTQNITATSTDGLYEVVVSVQRGKSGGVIYELRTLLFDSSGITDDRTRRRDDPSSKRRNRRGA